METRAYQIHGMSCQSCITKVKQAIEQLPEIAWISVQLEHPQARIRFKETLSTTQLQQQLNQAGDYQIKSIEKSTTKLESSDQDDTNKLPQKDMSTYRPLFIIIGLILVVSILAQYPLHSFSWSLWMRNFMAGFFIVFAAFKLINLSGFVNAYAMYDLLAKQWKSWGYIYPFLELILGLLYLTNVLPFLTNLCTIVILGFSSLGVIHSVLNQRQIKCACLGDVFQLPMSTITIIEDLSMVAMALLMLFL